MWVTTLASATIAPAAGGAGRTSCRRRSPYIDLEYRQEFTLFGGYYNAGSDKVGVAPAERTNVRRALRPAARRPRVADVESSMYVSSQRTIIDPRRPAATRVVQANASWPIYLADVGISLNLTGQRSYRRIRAVRERRHRRRDRLQGWRGCRARGDSAPRLHFRFGGGVKWVPAGNLQVRADFSDQLYQIKYPNSYYVTASDGTSVLTHDRREERLDEQPRVLVRRVVSVLSVAAPPCRARRAG